MPSEAHLSTAVTGQRVVPKALVRALDGLLVGAVVTVSRGEGGKTGNKSECLHCSLECAAEEGKE